MSAQKTSGARVAGFSEDGRRYAMRDVHLLESADSFLYNELMFIRIDHRGRCEFGHTHSGGPVFLQPNATAYSEGLRLAYVRDDDTMECWSAPYDPIQAEPDEFEFSPGVADITWRNVTNGIETTLRLVIPPDDTVEVWTVTARNVSRRKRRISLYPFFPIGWRGDLLNTCRFDEKLGGVIYEYFPYYVEVEDYYRNRRLKNMVFCAPDRKPTSWEAAMDGFKGGLLLHNPAALEKKRLGRGYANFEDGAAVFQYALNLAAGKSATVNLVFGPAKDKAEMRRLKKKYLAKGAAERARSAAQKFHSDRTPQVRIETPDSDFNHYVNHWLPRQTLWTGGTLRSSFAPCARNAITDAMGIIYNDPKKARYWFTRIWEHQEKGGWIKHGLPMREHVHMSLINTIPHRDMNTWGPQAIHMYVAETGDFAILDDLIPFTDDRKGSTLYEHICIGLDWLLKDRTKRGLARVGQGDWCDPLNMAGHNLKGESVMLTETLAWALDIWAGVADHRGDTSRAGRYRREAGNCRKAINRHAWDGRWYVRGFTDDGRAFGSSKNREGSIWVNAQGWAIISGADTPKRRKSAVAAVKRHLDTPVGVLMNGPAYTRFYEDIGKVTVKNPGIDENSSAYNSAVCWWAYAMFIARNADEGWRHLRGMLTGAGRNTIKRSGQLPLYVPNFYKGPAVGERAGESSHSPSTGTVAWFYHTAVSQLMGVRGELDGLRLDPQLPSAWKKARVWRKFRGAAFDISIRRSRKVDGPTVELDGERLADNLVPPQKPGTKHTVTVTIPG